MTLAALFIMTTVVAPLIDLPHDTQSAESTRSLQLIRLKPADPEMRRLVQDGYARSDVFRTVVDELQRSNAIVVVQFGTCANGRVRSCVSHVDGDARQRHIRIKVGTQTTNDRLIATIAHELSHAVEIAREVDVVNSEQALALYRRIATGRCAQGLSDLCETDAALTVERRVLQELERTGGR